MLRAKIIIIVMVCACFSGCSKRPVSAAPDFELPETGIYGQVTGNLAENAWVYAYRRQENNFRGPADFAARVETDGSYILDLLPGRWYLLARSRQQGAVTGRLQLGDTRALHGDNPLVLQQNEVQRIDFALQPATAIPLPGRIDVGGTGFSGRLLGPNGQPVVGAFAQAYRDRNFRRMPDYSSTAADADGHFLLYVDRPGRYCLVARQGTRGQPRQGELYGQLGADEAACREVKKGELLDIGEFHLKPYLR